MCHIRSTAGGADEAAGEALQVRAAVHGPDCLICALTLLYDPDCLVCARPGDSLTRRWVERCRFGTRPPRHRIRPRYCPHPLPTPPTHPSHTRPISSTRPLHNGRANSAHMRQSKPDYGRGFHGMYAPLTWVICVSKTPQVCQHPGLNLTTRLRDVCSSGFSPHARLVFSSGL